MRKTAFLLLFSILLIGGGLTVKKKVFNAGEVLEGNPIIHEFILENHGKKPINIKRVRTSCGCTTAGYDRTIPPGGKGKIVLRVRTMGYQGRISKRAFVDTDDPDLRQFTLTINAVVKPIVKIEPNKFVFVRKRAGEEATSEITLSSEVYPDFRITKVTVSQQRDVRVEFEKQGRKWRVRLYFSRNMKLGQNRGYIRIWTDIKKYPVVWVNYLCEVEGKIKVLPNTLTFSKSRPGINFRVVTIRAKEKGIKIKLKKCPAGFDCFLHSVKGGYILLVVMETPPSGPLQDKIELTSNVKNEEHLEIGLMVR